MSKNKSKQYKGDNFLALAIHYNKIKETYLWYNSLKFHYNRTHNWDTSLIITSSIHPIDDLDSPPAWWLMKTGADRRAALKQACQHYLSEKTTLEEILSSQTFGVKVSSMLEE